MSTAKKGTGKKKAKAAKNVILLSKTGEDKLKKQQPDLKKQQPDLIEGVKLAITLDGMRETMMAKINKGEGGGGGDEDEGGPMRAAGKKEQHHVGYYFVNALMLRNRCSRET